MRLTTLTAVIVIALAVAASWTITMACDTHSTDTENTAAAVADADETTAPECPAAVVAEPATSTITKAKSAVRAGVNLSKALGRAAASLLVTVAKSAYTTLAAVA